MKLLHAGSSMMSVNYSSAACLPACLPATRVVNLRDVVNDVYEFHGVTNLGNFVIYFALANLVRERPNMRVEHVCVCACTRACICVRVD
jgi:hypothetical protein